MSLNIPDSIPKLFVLIGIIGLAVGFYVEKELTEDYYTKFDKFAEIQDLVKLESYIVDLELDNLIERSKQLSKIYNLENPISEKDSTITFNQTFFGDKKKVELTDSLSPYWDNYIKKKKKLDILNKRREIKSRNIDSEEKLMNSRREFYSTFSIIGSIILVSGLFSWAIEGSSKSKRLIKQSDKLYDNCQSCGHNFSSIRHYGSENDKTENFAFCIDCYKNGEFQEPDLTREDFLKRKKEILKKSNWFTRRILMVRFRNLERWNKNNYF